MDAADKPIEYDRMSMISEASIAISQIKRSDMTEVKSFAQPPEAVKDVLTATLVLLGRPKSEQTWKEAKKMLANIAQSQDVLGIDPDKIPVETRREAMKYLSKYSREEICKTSKAVCSFYDWAKAVASE